MKGDKNNNKVKREEDQTKEEDSTINKSKSYTIINNVSQN